MKTRETPHPEDHLDGAFISHLLFWIVGGMTAVGFVLTIGAFFTMGRSSYRKD